MKRFVILIAVLAAVSISHGQVGTYTIESDVEGIEGKSFYLTIWNGTSEVIYKDGKLNDDSQIFYSDTTSVPLVIRIGLGNDRLYKDSGAGFYPVKSQSIWLVASPGDDITLKGHISDFAEVYPEGGEENNSLVKLTKEFHPLINAAVNISVTLDTMSNKLSQEEIQELSAKREQLNEQADQVMQSYLMNNASSIAGLYYLNDMLMRKSITPKFAEQAIESVDDHYKATPYYDAVYQRVEGSKYDVGSSIFDLVSNKTPDGTEFNSKGWEGKFYLIDFWGSWCVPCLKDVPFLKNLKESHASKLNVLGIASDKEASWRQAIHEYDLNWTHILNGTGEEDFVARLNVDGFPTKILVAPNGEIVYRSSGGGEESFKIMADIIDGWK